MKYLIYRRFIEVAGLCLLSSVILSALSVEGSAVIGLVPICFVMFAVAYFIINIRMLRKCYFDLAGIKEYSFEVSGAADGIKAYYIGNIISYLIFAVINIVLCVTIHNTTYTWLYAITKFARYFGENVSTLESALLFHFIMLMSVLCAPIGLKQKYAWRFVD